MRNEDKAIRRDHRLMIKVSQIEDDIVDVCAELKEELGHYFSWRQARLLSYGAKLSSVLVADERDTGDWKITSHLCKCCKKRFEPDHTEVYCKKCLSGYTWS